MKMHSLIGCGFQPTAMAEGPTA